MKDSLNKSIEQILADINAYIFAQNSTDTEHCYIDGTKIMGECSWV